MHKRMRRGKEMYPSFDTRRVLCKQHRPYCVKPFGAYLSHLVAFNAEAQSLRNMAGNIARNALKRAGEKGAGLPFGSEGRFSQMLKGRKGELTARKITTASAKNSAHGMKPTTSQLPICANARSAKNSMCLALRAPRFVLKSAEKMSGSEGLALFTTQRPRKGESKSANTEVETL